MLEDKIKELTKLCCEFNIICTTSNDRPKFAINSLALIDVSEDSMDPVYIKTVWYFTLDDAIDELLFLLNKIFKEELHPETLQEMKYIDEGENSTGKYAKQHKLKYIYRKPEEDDENDLWDN